ncbi:hypothetical protein TrVE_jg13366 [Triparma verrucosa]|uniref:V-type proton ATPase subunit C n=2 Tax=Triparma TaxID=722752 RepID=A0A9W7EII7_9STRA|nr:hypothetical protein TrST_g6981 [Triparma strigata]GMI04833.1 hypothetical protein TrVE_jg13366 [Triparma verrucosa]
MSSEFLFVTVPNTDSADTTLRNLHRASSSSATLFKIDVPVLLVGTLDTLMNLSDDLAKQDMAVESVVKKIERTHQDLSKTEGSIPVNGISREHFTCNFAWDYAKYPHKRPLKELVTLVTTGVASIEEELRNLSTTLADKASSLSEMRRKKAGSMLVSDLSSTLPDSVVSQINLLDSEYLKTVFVAVPKSLKQTFLSSYHTIGSDLVSYGPSGSRDSSKGSPCVPGSAKCVLEDFESSLFTLTILKSQYTSGHYEGTSFKSGSSLDFLDLFSKACRDKRYVMKDYTHSPGAESRSKVILEEGEAKVEHMQASLGRWCKAHYGEAFTSWVHLKVIRVFIESVLRYGLPVNSTTCVYQVKAGKGDVLQAQLVEMFKHLSPEEDDGEKEEGGEEFLPYVCQKFNLD